MLTYILYLFLGLLAIGFVVFLHELGHFAAARMLGVEVEVLSYGMGPKVFSIYGRKTEYRLSLFLFGGYCRMKGSLDLMKALKDDSKYINRAEEGSYFGTSAFVRFLIYLAGPLTNFLLAVLLLSAASLIPVERLSDEAIVTPVTEYSALFSNPVSQESIHKGDKLISSSGHIFLDWQDAEAFIKKHSGSVIPVTVLRDGEMIDTAIVPHKTADGWSYGLALLQKAVVGSSLSDSFQPGDRIIAIDGTGVRYLQESREILKAHSGSSVTASVARGKDTLAINLQVDTSGLLGIYTQLPGIQRKNYSVLEAIPAGINLTFNTIGGYIQDIRLIFTPRTEAYKSVGSFIMMGQIFPASWDWYRFINILALLSIMLGVMNLLPIPALDGGHIVFTIYEMVTGRKPSDKFLEGAQIVGMILLFGLMLLAFGNDIGRLMR